MRPIEDKTFIKTEWERSLSILLSQDCLYIANDSIFVGNNTKLFSILHNVILPFIDIIYVMCILLSEVRNLKEALNLMSNNVLKTLVRFFLFSGLKERR
jgi:hypothetical protein